MLQCNTKNKNETYTIQCDIFNEKYNNVSFPDKQKQDDNTIKLKRIIKMNPQQFNSMFQMRDIQVNSPVHHFIVKINR